MGLGLCSLLLSLLLKRKFGDHEGGEEVGVGVGARLRQQLMIRLRIEDVCVTHSLSPSVELAMGLAGIVILAVGAPPLPYIYCVSAWRACGQLRQVTCRPLP